MSIESYRALLDATFDDSVRRWTCEAERAEHFPRELLEYLGQAGVFSHKWSRGGPTGGVDLPKLVELAYHLGALGSAGISVGVSLHDSAIAILRRFGRSDHLRDVAERAIRGEAVLCLAASESSGGSDLQIVGTRLEPEGDGYRVRGRKKFVSLSPIADYILVVCRRHEDAEHTDHGNVALVLVPTTDVRIEQPYRKLGAAPLDTAAVSFDVHVPADALIARPGTGLAAVSWGLAHERLSIAGQAVASSEYVLGVTLARMKQRTQFGSTLYEHQALRLRIADLAARVEMMRHALEGIAARPMNLRTAAAAKVSAARLGEEVVGECVHIFGGAGYLVDETPLGRWWRDMKLARVGGGTDEVLWELVAAALRPDVAGYADVAAGIT
nr:acyl-CoA dehydrogenase family protein [Millisia brevis]